MNNNDNTPRIPAPEIRFQGKQILMRKSPTPRLLVWLSSSAAVVAVVVTFAVSYNRPTPVVPLVPSITYALPAQQSIAMVADTVKVEPTPVVRKITARKAVETVKNDTMAIILPPPRTELPAQINIEELTAHVSEIELPELLKIEHTQHMAIEIQVAEPRSNLMRIIASMDKPQYRPNSNINQFFAKR